MSTHLNRWVAHLQWLPSCNLATSPEGSLLEFVAFFNARPKRWNKNKIAEAKCLQHLTWSICDLTSIPHIYTSGMSNTTEFIYRVGVTGIVSLRKNHEKWESLKKCSHGDLRNVFLSQCSVPFKGHQWFVQKSAVFLDSRPSILSKKLQYSWRKYKVFFERSSSLEDVPKNCMRLSLRM